MRTPIYRRVSKSEMRGWVDGEVLDRLPPTFLDDPVSSVQKMGGETIKESRWRWASLLSLPDGTRIFFKRDKTKDWMECLKYLFFPSKGRKEFLIASQLGRGNLDTPKPLGWMEKTRRGLIKESYYLSEAIGTGVSFIEETAKSREPHAILQLATTVRKCQDAGLFHQDLHAGNFLWEGDSLFLTDLHRTKIVKRLSQKQRLWNLAHLFHSLRSAWGEREQLQFLALSDEGSLTDSQRREILFRKIYPVMDRLQKRQWRSRTKRCLKESTEFTVHTEKGVRYFRRRDFPAEDLRRVLEKHLDLVRKSPFLLIKDSPEVVVSILDNRGEKICLKQFRYPCLWDRVKEYFRRSKGIKSWVAANGMRARGLPSLKPLALVERKNWVGLKESVLFMEALAEDQEMDRYVLKGFGNFSKKRLFIQTFARWLGSLHKMDVYHKDMKTCNILVSERGETWNFHLLDFEDILTDEKVNRKKLFRNFLQLNTSTPKIMTRSDRFRFFKEYLRLNPVVKEEKIFLRGLMKESRRRGLVYVSAHGVVTEEMG
ncbi:MAG: lipopolysaccharide kinase InaA family protein [Thermodesulfobacteriota bacterium]